MSQSNQETDRKDPESGRVRFPVQTAAPPKKVLDDMLAECLRDKNKLIELPVEIPKFAETFRLTVEIELNGERAIWNLYAGQGATTRTLWTYALRDTDMICEVLSLSVSTPPPPAADTLMQSSGPPADAGFSSFGWPDELKVQPEAAPVKESAPKPQQTQAPPQPKAKQSAGAPQASSEAGQPNIMLGHILVDSGLIPEPVLDAALSLQEMVRHSTLTPDEATDALRKMHARGADLEDIVAELKKKRMEKPPVEAVDLLRQSGIVSDKDITKARQVMEQLRKAGLDSDKANENGQVLLELLRLAGFISDEDIRRAATASSNRPPDILKTLLSSGSIDSLCFEVASRFVKYVRLGTFRQDQAVMALHYSQRMRTNFEDTVHSMGWTVPVEK